MKLTDNPKIQYIIKIMDLLNETESKKHGYYKVLRFGDFKFSWDSWNGNYYLNRISMPGYLELADYVDIIYKECLKNWNLPSIREDKHVPTDLIDYLYLTDANVRKFFD